MIRASYLALTACCVAVAVTAAQSPHIAIETALGVIEVELEPARAPVTVASFLKYIDEGLYDGGRFHRAVTLDNQVRNDVKIEVIQGGCSPESVSKTRGYGPIVLERTSVTGLKHVDGTISMARGSNPDSAVSDFFICVNDQPSLDFGGSRSADRQGFAAFGRVVRGMDVVRAIQQAPAPGERLTPPIQILKIYRIRRRDE